MVTIISQLASTVWESTQLTLGRDAAEPERAVVWAYGGIATHCEFSFCSNY